MTDASPTWTLANFAERFDAWAEQEKPSQEVRIIVSGWILSRLEDPYRHARRERGFDNLWFAWIPNTADEAGNRVACSYWIFELTRTVSCDLFGTLSLG